VKKGGRDIEGKRKKEETKEQRENRRTRKIHEAEEDGRKRGTREGR
jgi:hypothetical protein